MSKSKNFFEQFNVMYESALDAGNADLVEILDSLRGFVETTEFMQRSTYDYVGRFFDHSNREIAMLDGVTDVAVHRKKSRHSDRLFELFGEDLFNLVYEADPVSAIQRRIDAATQIAGGAGTGKDLLVPSVAAYLYREIDSGSSSDEINIRDCKKEAYFLAAYSKATLDQSINSLDQDKLSYLLAVIEGKAGTVSERNSLSEGLRSGIRLGLL